MARKQTAFRFTPEVDQKLNEIAKVMGMTRNDVVVNWIQTEYDKIMGNPELLKIIEQMNALKEQLELYGKG